jgi:hypothetical protein
MTQPSGEHGGVGANERETELNSRFLETVVDPTFLKYISNASGGFAYTVLDSAPSGVKTDVGFTDMRTRRIYMIRKALERFLGSEDGTRKIRGFLAHEAGHHAPDVVVLDKMLRDQIGKSEYEPIDFKQEFDLDNDKEALGGRVPVRQLFWRAVSANVNNVALDIWLEQLMGKAPFVSAKRDFQILYELEDHSRQLRGLPIHDQFTQWIVGEQRYLHSEKRMTNAARAREVEKAMKTVLDPETQKAVNELLKKGAMRALMDVTAWEGFSSTTQDQERAIKLKFEAVMGYILPAWASLLKKSLDKAFDNSNVPPFDCKKNDDETDEEYVARRQSEEKIYFSKMAVIRYELLRKLLEDDVAFGQGKYGVGTPDFATEAEREGALGNISPMPSKGDRARPQPRKATSDELMRERMRGELDNMNRRRIEEDADRFGVSAESLRQLLDLIKKYETEINELAEGLAESFLSQRRAVTEYHRLEGRLTLGMETFAIAEARRGNDEAMVHEAEVQASDFTSTDVELLLDTSGSMQGGRLEIGLAFTVVLQEAFKKVQQMLRDEQLLRPEDEQPLRIGSAGFTDTPYRVKKLSEPLTDKSLAQLIHQANTRSGGTDDAAAIEALSTEFKKNSEATLKFLVIISDGEGNPGAVQSIIDSIEKSDDMLVVVCGLGSDPQSVIDTYDSMLKGKGISNVLPLVGDSVKEILPELIKFLKKKIADKTNKMSV